MTVEKNTQKIPHNVIMSNREKLSLTGVTDVGKFDSNVVVCYLSSGELVIKGENLRVDSVNTTTGDMEVNGKINALIYTEQTKTVGLISKIFK
ncbi:MAG: YabP/YqfC family sporulation protein [Oscillospiraceae bacterium]|nr:YabP/YqfC family sporulation protein [Oscillospiraceae bacterium]